MIKKEILEARLSRRDNEGAMLYFHGTVITVRVFGIKVYSKFIHNEVPIHLTIK